MLQSQFNEFADSGKFQQTIEKTEQLYTVGQYKSFLVPEYTADRSWKAYIASSKNAPMASVIAFAADAPLRTRNVLRSANGDIPTLGHMRQMDKGDIRRYLQAKQNPNIAGKDIFRILFNDVEAIVNGTIDRVDYMFWQAISEGRMLTDVTNNPDGTVDATEVSIGMTADQKFGTVGVTWGNAAATPITDLENVIKTYYEPKGLKPINIKMTRSLYRKMVKATQIINGITGSEIVQGSRTLKLSSPIVRESDVIDLFAEAGLPPIVIIEKSVNVEKYVKNDATGKYEPTISAINAFNEDNVSFTTTEKYGRLQWTFVNEMLSKEPIKSYATFDSYVLLKRWRANGSEFTESEAMAVPVIDAVDGMALLNTQNQGSYS